MRIRTSLARRFTVLTAAVLVVATMASSAFAIEYAVHTVPSGSASSSAGPSSSNYCHSIQYPYSWWHGIAYSVNTNTGARQMTINYLDFYGGDTNPDPPYTVPPAIETIWSGDSWVYSNSDAYRFGQLSAFGGQQFDSYDITLWMYAVIDYPANDWVVVHTKFGENDGGDVSGSCHSASYLYLDPPN